MKIFILFTLFLWGCREASDTPDRQSALHSEPRKQLVDGAPLFGSGYYIKQDHRPIVPLDSIEDGFDSLQIRIWQEQGLFGHTQLYVFRNSQAKWEGFYYEFMLDSNYASGQGDSKFLKGPRPFEVADFRKLQPKMGWKPFVDSLIALRIRDLPDYSEVPNMNPKSTDPAAIHVEVSTSSTYRYYTLLNVNAFSDKFWPAEKMSKILQLLFDELGNIPRFA